MFGSRPNKPYKSIVIEVYPDFIPRLTNYKAGRYKRGITSNLSIMGYMAFLFEINEYLPIEHKLTDYQISRCLVNEFPDSPYMQGIKKNLSGEKVPRKENSLSFYRRLYNSGRLFKDRRPRGGPISYRYNSGGEKISFHSRKPITQAEIERTLIRFGPDRKVNQDFAWGLVEKKTKNKKKRRVNPTYESFDWCI